MSDLLIRGIGMPTEKPIAVVIHPDGTAYCAEMFAGVCTKYLNDCVAIPVQPHSRLIDADALMLKILDYIDEYSDLDEDGLHNFKWCAMKEAEMAINEAETIIGGEEHEA